MFWVLIFVIAVASGFLQSMSGFGYSVVSMTTLPLMISPLSATTVSGVVGNLQSIVLTWNNRKHIRYKVTVIPLIASSLFAWIAITLMAQHDTAQYKQILGVFLIFIALYLLFFNDKIKIRATVFTGIVTGIISGVANGLFGMGGPPAVMYMMAATDTKEEYLSTIQFFFLISGLANTVARIANGALTQDIFYVCLLSILGMLVGGFLGAKMFNKLTQEQVGKFVYGFMMVMGLVIVLQG